MSRTNRPLTSEPQVIGRSALRVDALTKVTGEERYAADYYPENHLWVGVKRATYPHARLTSIDSSQAKDMVGVATVLTSQDVPGSNRLGIFEKDQPILADGIVRHYGDAIALVTAETKEILEQALAAIVVEYEPLAAVFDPEEALANDAVVLHPERVDGNVLLRGEISCGRGAEALADCAFTAKVSIKLNWQDHAFLETESGVAWLEKDGTIAMIVSTQTPFRDRLELAEALKISPNKFRVMAPHLGGAFGGKDGLTVQGFLALAALHSGGRPVKMWYSREERFLAGTKRHPAVLNYTLGCDREGTLHTLDCSILMDTGAYSALGGEVLGLAMEHAGGPYCIPHTRIKGAVVYTNNPVASAFRGFGVPQVAAGIEQVVDELAKVGGFDPLQFRLKNAVRRGSVTPTGVLLTQTVGIGECLAKVQEHRLWRERQSWQNSSPPFKRRGVGLAACYHAVGFGPVIPDYANAKLELSTDGRIRVYVGVVDMGQGNASTYMQIVGHILFQGYDTMELVLPDTSQTLPSASSSASRTTFTYGNALIGAANILKERILARALLLFSFQLLEQLSVQDLVLLPGRILHQPSGREVPLKMVAGFMDDSERITTYSYTCPVNKQVLSTGGNLRLHGFPHRVFSYGVQLVRLQVDTLTGEVEVCDLLNCIEAGSVLNPQVFEQQIQGGAAQGIGYALFEDFALEDGKIRTNDFSTYILPTAMDIPNMETVVVALAEDDGPYGMKGAGEISIDGILAAISNGLAGIIGTRLTQGTLTGEKILLALRQTGKEGVR
ncbi:xanthine dehydrogenase family protein molybdopterin-binding subunit [Desulfosporosinus fructosivorans]|uniref:Xanthine dehydrogenase family protein molybdopterin-binding subunit n=1 Tax=Desulfosporosinus fructosivorans TaxID=2018669 RepID=A0A4Z0QY95_9FIRM|nr:xanthine dehydrogenase family protein molybdopterin-binding subunit [Desulfosporosinus fructosivorans]TGE35742.1 xanthine dehydrogenase family protein molybdopterin-binding subunit [Desulfosporosinus fructosivorans]